MAPGPGRPPTDFYAPIDYELRQGQQVPVSIMDRVDQTMRTGAFLHDVAARIGFPVETLREWRKIGNRVARDLLQGSRRHAELTVHERQCGELALRMERAEAEGKVRLLVKAQQLAMGGQQRKERSVRTVNGVVVETIERQIEAAPDSAMLRWMLSHRWPNDFAGRVEVTGAEGGPVNLHMQSPRKRFDELLADVANARAETDDDVTVLAGTNGHGTNGDAPPANGQEHHA